jgi:CheY-like chemotaxis protein
VAARDQAERAGHAKTAFLATMSHEIRTPLNAVLGLTDLLLATDLTDEQRGHLETVAGSGDSLLSLINDVLDFSKIEAGELDLEAAPFDLVGVVYDVAQMLAPQATGAGLDLLVDVVGDGPWQVVGDAARFRQVVTNLVGNAVKFTRAGQVVLRSDRDGGGRAPAVLAVGRRHRDRHLARGAPPAVPLLQPGRRLGDPVLRRHGPGSGDQPAHHPRHGRGHPGAERARCRVDLHRGRRAALAAVSDGPSAAGLAGLRVLVVDDSPTNLRILEHQLTGHGAACVLAGSGADALELLDRGPGWTPPSSTCTCPAWTATSSPPGCESGPGRRTCRWSC